MPDSPERRAACGVVDHLRRAGHVAYLVGGCVRDELLGREPREFDVATSATPEQVQATFRHTVPVGARFGVVIVVTPDGGNVEVATFRSDEAYVDGRRPTGVVYGTAEEDCTRRDFTVNGLYMDPATGEILDLVGGRQDLERRVVRAIGDPRARFAEDKLRMLRAVRFAATLGFEIDPRTWVALVEMAHEVRVVSWERIREELSRILVSGRAAEGFRMLRRSGLLAPVLPEIEAMSGVEQPPEFHPEGDVLVHTFLGLEHFDALEHRPLELGLAILLHDVGKPATFKVAERIRFDGHDRKGAEMSDEILRRLRYPNAVIQEVVELVDRHMAFVQIGQWREAKVRRFLTGAHGQRHLDLHRLDCLSAHGKLDTWRWATERREAFLAEPPPPLRLVTGDDLLVAGYPRGPLIGRILAEVGDEILECRVATREEAMAWITATFPVP